MGRCTRMSLTGMKRWIAAAVLAATACGGVTTSAWAYAGVAPTSTVVNGHAVELVYADLNDKNIEVKAVSAWDKAGLVEPLSLLAARNGALAALNGGYFNAYSDKQPLTVVKTDGQFVHNGAFGAVFGADADNNTYFGRVYPTISGSTNGSWVWPNNWTAWGVNHYYNDANAVVIYTPQGQKRPLSGGKTVVVQNGVVTAVVNGDAAMPTNGYLIHYGPGIAGEAARVFQVGEKVAWKESYGNDVDWSHVGNLMGGGPLLVSGGAVVVNPQAEKFTDPKSYSPDYRATRTFVGVTPDNKLVMGTVSGVNVYELANTVQALGVMHAVGMDAGATAGLWADGAYRTSPGREVPNAIIVKLRAPQTPNVSGYQDVYNNHWALNSINRLREIGIMSGSVQAGGRYFYPSKGLTRGEFATLLTKAFDLQPGVGPAFADAAGTWYEPYMKAVVQAGMMSGFGPDWFGGGDLVSQEQVVAVLSRALAKRGVQATKPVEWLEHPPSEWAAADVQAAQKQGIFINSFGDGLFRPRDAAKREGVAVILDEAMWKIGK